MPGQKKSWVEVPQYERPGSARIPHASTGAPKPAKPTPSPTRHSHAQEALFSDWLVQQVRLEVAFNDGSTLCGTLTDFDTYALTIANGGYPTLVFKSAVRWIRLEPTDSATASRGG